MKIKKVAAVLAALTITATMGISSFSVSAADDTPQPTSLTVTTERSAHTYTYFQIFTGTWYEDENHNIILSDADWGSNIDSTNMLKYLKKTYTNQINDIYIKRAVLCKLVNTGATIADVEAAVKAAANARAAGTGDQAWADSDYNIANFSKVEDVLDLFKVIQKANPELPDANPLVQGFSESPIGKDIQTTPNVYSSSADHSVPISNGNAKMVDIISKFVKGNGETVKANYNEAVTKTVDNGYYLVLEKDEGWDSKGRNLTNEAKWATLMKIVNREITITPKIGTPSLEKKIAENIKDVDAVGKNLIGGYSDNDKWNDAGDYSIGDTVEFALFGSVPENVDDFDHYFYQFKDRLAKGFVAPAAKDIKVEIGKLTPTAKPSESDDATAASKRTFEGTDVTDKAKIAVTENADGSSAIRVTFDDLKAAGVDVNMDTVVRVRYGAVLDTDAVLGEKGNTNGASLVFSSDFNYDGSGFENDETGNTPGGEDKENNSKGGKHTTTSETVEDGVTAFTYQIDVTKIDGEDNKKLANAVFTLQAKSGAHNGKYVVVNADGTVKDWTDSSSAANYLTTDANGKINIKGVDDGVYEIAEVKAPKGYNRLRGPISVTINAGLNKDGTYTYIADDGSAAYLSFDKSTDAGENAATVDKKTGTYFTTIANNKGLTPVETGGVGTVALAVSGNILLAAGAVYFLGKTKKNKENA